MNFLPVLSAGTAGDSGIMLLVMIVVMAVFYIFIFRKQSKEQKQHDLVVSSVETGDSILTSSGFYGMIIDINDDTVIVEFGNNKNCRIPMKKECIAEVEKAKK